MYSSGPGRRACFNTSLSDLGDVDGFDREADSETVYALKYSNGVYKRHEAPTLLGAHKLEDLSDVNLADAQPNVLYNILKNNEGKWVLLKKPNWVVDLAITPSTVMMGVQHFVNKITNLGTELVSYAPSKKNGVLLVQRENASGDRHYYMSRYGDLRTEATVHLGIIQEFETAYKVNRNSTLYMEVFLLEPPEDFITVIPGLNIKWGADNANKHCIICVRGGEAFSKLTGIQFQTRTNMAINKIMLPQNLQFKCLKLIEEVLPQDFLEALTKLN